GADRRPGHPGADPPPADRGRRAPHRRPDPGRPGAPRPAPAPDPAAGVAAWPPAAVTSASTRPLRSGRTAQSAVDEGAQGVLLAGRAPRVPGAAVRGDGDRAPAVRGRRCPDDVTEAASAVPE